MSLVQAKCTNCGASIEVDPQTEAGICPYCKTAYITQKAIVNYNMTIINHNTIHADTVNIVGGDYDNFMKIARESWDGHDFEGAYQNFTKALEIKPDSEEAALYRSLCLGWKEHKTNYKIILNTYHRVFDKIDFKTANNEQIEILNYFLKELDSLNFATVDNEYKQYDPDLYDTTENIEYVWQAIESGIYVQSEILKYSDKIVNKTNECKSNHIKYMKRLLNYYQTICMKWKYLMPIDHRYHSSIYHPDKERYKKLQEEIINEIKKYDPNYQASQKQGCYIATAVYGSYDCSPVWVLRRFRDEKLGQTFFGRIFIKFYYAISPTLVKWFGNSKWFQNFWKKRLNNLVERLKNEGVADTPYQDKNWRRK